MGFFRELRDIISAECTLAFGNTSLTSEDVDNIFHKERKFYPQVKEKLSEIADPSEIPQIVDDLYSIGIIDLGDSDEQLLKRVKSSNLSNEQKERIEKNFILSMVIRSLKAAGITNAIDIMNKVTDEIVADLCNNLSHSTIAAKYEMEEVTVDQIKIALDLYSNISSRINGMILNSVPNPANSEEKIKPFTVKATN